MAVREKDKYKDIKDELRKYNSNKETAYMLCMVAWIGLVLTIVILAISESL